MERQHATNESNQIKFHSNIQHFVAVLVFLETMNCFIAKATVIINAGASFWLIQSISYNYHMEHMIAGTVMNYCCHKYIHIRTTYYVCFSIASICQ